MCCSRIGQILYGIGMLVACGLTIAGLLTPGWRLVEGRLNQTSGVTVNPKNPGDTASEIQDKINMGILSFACTAPGEQSQSNAKSEQAAVEYCKDWWNNQPTWEKIVVILVLAALAIEVIALVYNLITFCCCCCRGHMLKPLGALALLALICLCVAIAIYAIKNRDALENSRDWKNPQNTVGYSFYLECGAVAFLFGCFVVGLLSAWLGDKCL